jgi:hypothetical protein
MIRSASLITILICSATSLGGQATPRVPPRDRVYRDIDRLAAARLIDTLIVGARPFSEREIVRVLEGAAKPRRNPSARAWAEWAIGLDLAHFARLHDRVVDAAVAEVVGLDSPYRGIPSDANGVVDAAIQSTGGKSRRVAPWPTV